MQRFGLFADIHDAKNMGRNYQKHKDMMWYNVSLVWSCFCPNGPQVIHWECVDQQLVVCMQSILIYTQGGHIKPCHVSQHRTLILCCLRMNLMINIIRQTIKNLFWWELALDCKSIVQPNKKSQSTAQMASTDFTWQANSKAHHRTLTII